MSMSQQQKSPTMKWKWSRSVLSDSLGPHGLWPTRFLRPWDFPGKSTGVGCHFLLQGIFPTQGSKAINKTHRWPRNWNYQFSSVQFSRSVVSDSLHWKLKELLGWPKRSFSFLGKNKRHIFHFHQELSFLFFFFFTENFIQQCIPCFVPLPSAIFFRQLHKSIFPKLCIFLSKQLFQVPYTVFQGIESFSINL